MVSLESVVLYTLELQILFFVYSLVFLAGCDSDAGSSPARSIDESENIRC